MSGCPAMVLSGKRRGEVCGKPIVRVIARGHGRCHRHASFAERARVLAVVRAERDLRLLRDLMPSDHKPENEPRGDEQPQSGVSFDAERFASADLDE